MAKSVAIVTGASQGIGRATAIRLARDFSSLVLVARNRANLEQTAEAVRTAGAEALLIDADLSEPAAAQSVADQTLAAFGRIDALLNIAGAVPQIDLFEMTDAQWEGGLALKLHGARRLTIAAWPALKEAKGAVVLMSGNSALFPKAPYAAVGTINAAIVALAKAFSDRGIADGVQVNSVLPGPVMTGRRRSYLEHWAPLHDMTVEEATANFPKEAGIAQVRRAGGNRGTDGLPRLARRALDDRLEPSHGRRRGQVDLTDRDATTGLNPSIDELPRRCSPARRPCPISPRWRRRVRARGARPRRIRGRRPRRRPGRRRARRRGRRSPTAARTFCSTRSTDAPSLRAATTILNTSSTISGASPWDGSSSMQQLRVQAAARGRSPASPARRRKAGAPLLRPALGKARENLVDALDIVHRPGRSTGTFRFSSTVRLAKMRRPSGT